MAHPGLLLSLLANDKASLFAGGSGLAVQESLRRSCWFGANEGIGAGLSRSELYRSSTANPAQEFPFIAVREFEELLAPELGAKVSSVMPRVGGAALLYLEGLKEIEAELSVMASNFKPNRSIKAKQLDGAVITGVGISVKKVESQYPGAKKEEKGMIWKAKFNELPTETKKELRSAFGLEALSEEKTIVKGKGKGGGFSGKSDELLKFQEDQEALEQLVTVSQVEYEFLSFGVADLMKRAKEQKNFTREALNLLERELCEQLESYDLETMVTLRAWAVVIDRTGGDVSLRMEEVQSAISVGNALEKKLGEEYRVVTKEVFDQFVSAASQEEAVGVNELISVYESGSVSSKELERMVCDVSFDIGENTPLKQSIEQERAELEKLAREILSVRKTLRHKGLSLKLVENLARRYLSRRVDWNWESSHPKWEGEDFWNGEEDLDDEAAPHICFDEFRILQGLWEDSRDNISRLRIHHVGRIEGQGSSCRVENWNSNHEHCQRHPPGLSFHWIFWGFDTQRKGWRWSFSPVPSFKHFRSIRVVQRLLPKAPDCNGFPDLFLRGLWGHRSGSFHHVLKEFA